MIKESPYHIEASHWHNRPKSTPKTNFTFTCGSNELKIADRYVYLGLTLTEFLDFTVLAKMVSQAAGRALGLLIMKLKLWVVCLLMYL